MSTAADTYKKVLNIFFIISAPSAHREERTFRQ